MVISTHFKFITWFSLSYDAAISKVEKLKNSKKEKEKKEADEELEKAQAR